MPPLKSSGKLSKNYIMISCSGYSTSKIADISTLSYFEALKPLKGLSNLKDIIFYHFCIIFRYNINKLKIGPSWSNSQLPYENSDTCPYLVNAAAKSFENCINFCTRKAQRGKVWLLVTLPAFLTWSIIDLLQILQTSKDVAVATGLCFSLVWLCVLN